MGGSTDFGDSEASDPRARFTNCKGLTMSVVLKLMNSGWLFAAGIALWLGTVAYASFGSR